MIPLYTLEVLVALCLIGILDYALGTRVVKKRGFWRALSLALVFQLLFDNITTRTGFWRFNPAVTLGAFLPRIPVENLLFGAGLFWLAAMVWTFSSAGGIEFKPRNR